MADFLDIEAELSDGEEDISNNAKRKSKVVMSDSEEEEEDDDENVLAEELKDLIDDTPIDESGESDDSDNEKSEKRRKSDEDYDDRLEDDDFDLIEENLGITVERRRYKRLKRVQDEESDEEDEQEVSKERETIANELFDSGSDDEDDRRNEISQRQPEILNDDESGNESSDADDFIVDDNGRPISEKRNKKRLIFSNPALQEAQDIFGVNFDYDEFEKYGEDYPIEDNDDDDEVDEGANKKRSSKNLNRSRKTIFEIYEPSELKRGHFTDIDNEIRNTDIPERMQLRSIPVTPVPENSVELNEESEWIYQQAFKRPTISNQNSHSNIDIDRNMMKGPETIPKIKKVLELIRNLNLEVPFISFYRKEYIKPELNMNDLWKIYKFDAKWCELRQRKNNLITLFENMKNYQVDEIMKNPDVPLPDTLRIIKGEDIERLKNIQTSEELNDIHHHFMLYYSNDIPMMHEQMRKKKYEVKRLEKIKQREKQLLEAGENTGDLPQDIEVEIKEEDTPEETMKQAVRTGPYAICRKAGLDTFAKKFGLTPEHFAENLRDNYQRHEVDQDPTDPAVVAHDYIGPYFKSTEEVLKAVQLMVATQIARDPLVRKCVREVYMERAKLTVRPTKKGVKEIDENHSIYTLKYLINKPVSDLSDDQYLKLSIAADDKLIDISFSDNIEGNTSDSYVDEIKQFYIRDEFSKNVQDWNNLRNKSVEMALTHMIIPDLKKELKATLLAEAKEYVMLTCCKQMYDWIKIAPYSCDFLSEDDEDWDTNEGIRVMAISFVADYSQAAYACIIGKNGSCANYVKLPHLLKRKNSLREDERILKEADLVSMKNFISSNKPHVIVIGGESKEAQMISNDVKNCLTDLTAEEQFPDIQVEILDNNLAKIFAKTNRGIAEFRDYPEILREAISLARRLQDPIIEFSQLCTSDKDILCLKFHSLQNYLPKEELLENLYLEFVNRVNEIGVDVNKAIQDSYSENILQFVCGLGPRKAHALIRILRQTIRRLENRTQLITACHMGPKIFINCAGFIKIDTDKLGDSTEAVVDVLDGSRIHPETYEWARKMAVDALEEEDPAEAMEQILKTPDRLKELDLDAFAKELNRQGCGDKAITLYDIRAELNGRYKDLRTPYSKPTPEELFNMLTKETPESFYIGKLVLATVIGISRRKPDQEQLDQANPVRHEDTGMWQCPFCLINTFGEMSEVWNHFDVGTCPGKANGVRILLENGLNGFIHVKNLSDNHVENPENRVKINQVIYCRIIKIDVRKFSVECSCKSSDLADKNGEWRPPKDSYYDTIAEEEDIKLDDTRKNKQRPIYMKRLNFHPLFHNVTYTDAQKLMANMKQGDAIVRPSSKGNDHLTITWKIVDNVYQHIDVKEEGKCNAFSLGEKLFIGNEEFEDLDEIIARYINPMAGYVTELLDHKKYKAGIDGEVIAAEKMLKSQKEASPKEIPYFLSIAKKYPGKFMLSYLPRTTCRHEYVSVTFEGYRYRGNIFHHVDDLIRWFKKHCFDPIPSRTPLAATVYQSNTNETRNSLTNTMDPEAIARVAQNLPNHMLHSLSQVANQTPHHGMRTPYTPSGQTPFMTPYQTPHYIQSTPRYAHQAPNNQFSHITPIISENASDISNNKDIDQFAWQTTIGITPSQQTPMNNTDGISFDWSTGGVTEGTQQKSGQYSHRSKSHNNGKDCNVSDWRSARNSRPRRGNMHQRPTPYSRQSRPANNDSFDWGSIKESKSNIVTTGSNNSFSDLGGSDLQTKQHTNTDDDMFDWGTVTESMNQTNTPTNNGNDTTSDWLTGTNTSNSNKSSANDSDRNSSSWGSRGRGRSMRGNNQRRPRSYSRGSNNSSQRNSNRRGFYNANRRSGSSSYKAPSQNSTEEDMFDWGTVTQTQAASHNENTTHNNDDNTSDRQRNTRTRSTHHSTDRSSRPLSHQQTPYNTADDNMFDWGTVGTESINQNEISSNSRRSHSFNNKDNNDESNVQSSKYNCSKRENMRQQSTSCSRRVANNEDDNLLNWRSQSERKRFDELLSSMPPPRKSPPRVNVDDDMFDWGTVVPSQSPSNDTQLTSTSSLRETEHENNENDNMFDWETENQMELANQNENFANNNNDNDTSNWETEQKLSVKSEISTNNIFDKWNAHTNTPLTGDATPLCDEN